MVKRVLSYISVLVCLNIAYGTHMKGLFCQDPDTRKVHPINATWQSETFCGNYSCKLRKKNISVTEFTPTTKVNITPNTIKNEYTSQDDMSTSPSEISYTVVKSPSSETVYKKDFQANDQSRDRLLTEGEIKAITEILHTVKKSDLEAIIEIYYLVQEIYEEMDSNNEEHVNETVDIPNKQKKNKNKESISQWYETSQSHNKKTKDLNNEGTNIMPMLPPYPYPPPYFKGPFPSSEVRIKHPPHYPVSNFHRMSSYLRTPYTPKPEPSEPCKKRHYMPRYPSKFPNPVQYPIQLLPYPFSYVYHNNLSHLPSFHYNNYPWAQLDMYNRIKNYPKLRNTYIQEENPYVEPEKVEVEQAVEEEIEVKEEKEDDQPLKLPEWQTEDLPKNVLEEVRANILEKSKLLKPLSLKKNIKLEKVGKLIKLEELLKKRRKRHISDVKNVQEDEYDAYIEKIICDTEITTEPGFFRVGNISLPYPACCPQKITS